jgi:hypothetical protein
LGIVWVLFLSGLYINFLRLDSALVLLLLGRFQCGFGQLKLFEIPYKYLGAGLGHISSWENKIVGFRFSGFLRKEAAKIKNKKLALLGGSN